MSELDRYLKDFAWQIERARDIACEAVLPPAYKKPEKVLFCGMGGSAISGDILGTVAQSRSRIHWTVNRSSRLPQWVDSKTLVILSSYSGNTQEVDSVFRQAIARKASFFVVTAGGRLLDQARKRKIPLFQLPQGYPPRCAIGFGTFALLFHFIRCRWFSVGPQEIEEVIRIARQFPAIQAKRLAKNIFKKNIHIYGGGLMQPVAVRWRTQFAENAKTLASCESMPEMFHHEIEGWIFPRFEIRRSVAIFLTDKNEPGWLLKKKRVAMNIIKGHGAQAIEVRARGVGGLARIFSMIILGDWTSFELARLNHIDPLSVCAIDRIKKAALPR